MRAATGDPALRYVGGGNVSAEWFPCKTAWVKRNEPEVYAKVADRLRADRLAGAAAHRGKDREHRHAPPSAGSTTSTRAGFPSPCTAPWGSRTSWRRCRRAS